MERLHIQDEKEEQEQAEETPPPSTPSPAEVRQRSQQPSSPNVTPTPEKQQQQQRKKERPSRIPPPSPGHHGHQSRGSLPSPISPRTPPPKHQKEEEEEEEEHSVEEKGKLDLPTMSPKQNRKQTPPRSITPPPVIVEGVPSATAPLPSINLEEEDDTARDVHDPQPMQGDEPATSASSGVNVQREVLLMTGTTPDSVMGFDIETSMDDDISASTMATTTTEDGLGIIASTPQLKTQLRKRVNARHEAEEDDPTEVLPEFVEKICESMVESETAAAKAFFWETKGELLGNDWLEQWQLELKQSLQSSSSFMTKEDRLERQAILESPDQGEFYVYLILKFHSILFACESLVHNGAPQGTLGTNNEDNISNSNNNSTDQAITVLRKGVHGTMRDVRYGSQWKNAIEEVLRADTLGRGASAMGALASLFQNESDRIKGLARAVYWSLLGRVLEGNLVERTARLVVRARRGQIQTTRKLDTDMGRFVMLVLDSKRVPQKESAQLAATILQRNLMHPFRATELYRLLKTKGLVPQDSLDVILTSATFGISVSETKNLARIEK